MRTEKFLVIEDSAAIVETVSIALEMRWPHAKVVAASGGERGIELVEAESPNAVILDLGLPDMSGFDVLRRIRLFSDVPILILTVSSDESDVVKGLEWGADDYMVKPFKQLELLARLQGVMRRYRPLGEKPLTCGQLRFDPASLRVVLGSNDTRVSRTEGLILGLLMRNPGIVVSNSSIAEALWGPDYPEARGSIKVHVRHLRQKLEQDPARPRLILTRPGVGYYLASPS